MSFLKSVFFGVVPVDAVYEIFVPPKSKDSSQKLKTDPPISASTDTLENLSPEKPEVNSAENPPPQPSRPSSTANTWSIGDYIHRRFMNWVSGEHVIDATLWDKSGYKIVSAHRYKSDLLRKGLNTPVKVILQRLAPGQSATTSTQRIEHQWTVAKAVDSNNNDTIWIASWKDFEGNIQVQQFSSLNEANRAASSTIGNDAGRNIKKIEDIGGHDFTVGNFIAYIKSIQASYHLTLCNCQDYAKNIMNALKNKQLPRGNHQVFTKYELHLLAEAFIDGGPPTATYTKKEGGLPFFRRVIVYKDGQEVGSFKRVHTRDARKDADTWIRDDKAREQKKYECQKKLQEREYSKNSRDPNTKPQPPKPPSELKVPKYTKGKEYGSRGSRKVEVRDEDGRVVKICRERHFEDARDEAELWIQQQENNARKEHQWELKQYKKDSENYQQELKEYEWNQKINQLKTGVTSAVTRSILDNGHLICKKDVSVEDLKTFGEKVSTDTVAAGTVTFASGFISKSFPPYTIGCSTIRSFRDYRVARANGTDLSNSVMNTGMKIVLNVGVPIAFASVIASNPITAGLALGFYTKGVDTAANYLFKIKEKNE